MHQEHGLVIFRTLDNARATCRQSSELLENQRNDMTATHVPSDDDIRAMQAREQVRNGFTTCSCTFQLDPKFDEENRHSYYCVHSSLEGVYARLHAL